MKNVDGFEVKFLIVNSPVLFLIMVLFFYFLCRLSKKKEKNKTKKKLRAVFRSALRNKTVVFHFIRYLFSNIRRYNEQYQFRNQFMF